MISSWYSSKQREGRVLQEIVCAEMSLISVGDSEVLPTLLTPLKSKINRVSADGAYDTKDCHELLRDRKI